MQGRGVAGALMDKDGRIDLRQKKLNREEVTKRLKKHDPLVRRERNTHAVVFAH